MVAVQCPAGLTEEQCGFFKQEIETMVSPARDSALNAYKTCVDKSNQLNVFTEYSTECVKVLEKASPESYPPLLERTIPYKAGEKTLDVRANSIILRHDAPGVAARADAVKGGGEEP